MRFHHTLLGGCLFLFLMAGPALAQPESTADPDAQAAAEAPASKTLARIEVRETASLDRQGWPIVLSLPLPADQVDGEAADGLRLIQVTEDDPAQPLPMQILEIVRPVYGEKEGEDELRLVELCFLADLPADATRHFHLVRPPQGAISLTPAQDPQLTYGTPPEAPEVPEGVVGLGATVDTGPVVFAFHPRSGQLLWYNPQLPDFDQPLTFVQGDPRPIHWNPDVWAPPLTWGHVSDWDVATEDHRPEFHEARGPIAYRTVREGVMPSSNGVKTSVSYTLFAGMPFVLESSRMEFTRDTEVTVVRDNELVFNRGQHTRGLWMDEQGEMQSLVLYDDEEPTKFHGYHAGIDPDAPLVALAHHERGYGIGAVCLERFAASPSSLAGVPTRGAHYYLLDYGEHGTEERFDYNFLYLSRTVVPGPTVVPEGSILAERSAFLVFQLDHEEGREYEQVQRWVELLRHPPKVTVHKGE